MSFLILFDLKNIHLIFCESVEGKRNTLKALSVALLQCFFSLQTSSAVILYNFYFKLAI